MTHYIPTHKVHIFQSKYKYTLVGSYIFFLITKCSNEDIVDEDDSYQYQLLKKKVMQDQKRVTRSAIELGQQRAELEAERWAFQEMKREIELQEILKEP